MSNLTNVQVIFSTEKKKSEMHNFICLNQLDFCNQFDVAKKRLAEIYGVKDVNVRSIHFNVLEVLEK